MDDKAVLSVSSGMAVVPKESGVLQHLWVLFLIGGGLRLEMTVKRCLVDPLI